MEGQGPFGSFWVLLKGTRRKGATLSGRYRSNGYTPKIPSRSGKLCGHWARYTRKIRPLMATATSSVAINKKAVLKLLAWAMKPMAAGPARIPA